VGGDGRDGESQPRRQQQIRRARAEHLEPDHPEARASREDIAEQHPPVQRTCLSSRLVFQGATGKPAAPGPVPLPQGDPQGAGRAVKRGHGVTF